MKAKGYKPGKYWENFVTAASGNRFEGTVMQFFDEWCWLFELLPNGKPPNLQAMKHYGVGRSYLKKVYRGLCSQMAGELDRAIKNDDGSFFRELADLIEAYRNLADPVRLKLLAKFFDSTGKQIRFLTCAETAAELRHAGYTISDRQCLRICEDIGIAFAKAPEGRPKKNSDKAKMRQS